MTGLDDNKVDTDDEAEVDDLQRVCGVCNAQPGDPCLDVAPEDGGDGRSMPRGVYHIGRSFPGPGPIRVQHTGTFNAEGGGIFRVVSPEGDEDNGAEIGENTAEPTETGKE